MIGKQARWQRHLFIAGDIDQFIPEDHILGKIGTAPILEGYTLQCLLLMSHKI